ncbi:N-acetylglucosamine-6-phosphate deacetylase [Pontimonas salivibrio]|uniref:N-acetylglucosamine-6-phosphate deacetylase n=1 Tax=Pontimonas salivibrio TaxID=1159327 RepID=A0A2L2BP72_9MICO|nr:N-acetylglucosamine-6-phosphate deacetylase [Pontimonas salivibrio]
MAIEYAGCVTDVWSVDRPGENGLLWGDTLIRGSGGFTPAAGQKSIQGAFVSPLLADTHTHGRGGMAVLPDSEQLEQLLEGYLACGVGAVQLSTVTLNENDLRGTLNAARMVRAARTELLGLHLEGPFLSAVKHGAHDRDLLRFGTLEQVKLLVGDYLDVVTSITLDPRSVDEGVIGWLVSQGVTVALGHTEANYAEMVAAFEEGATVLTHAFNAMNQIAAREPGPVLAAIDCGAWIEVIADGHHVHPSLVRLLFDRAPARVVLVSDSMPAAGLGDGAARLGGIAVTVQDNVARTVGGALAGSTLTLSDSVSNVASWGVDSTLAINAATVNPHHAYGLNAPSLNPGAPANLLVWSTDMELTHILRDGRVSAL